MCTAWAIYPCSEILEHSPNNSEAVSEKVESSRQGVFPDLKLSFTGPSLMNISEL